jgi:hypothetical protein
VVEAKHSRNKSAIQKCVDQKFKIDGGFALVLKISVLYLISKGIMFFSI